MLRKSNLSNGLRKPIDNAQLSMLRLVHGFCVCSRGPLWKLALLAPHRAEVGIVHAFEVPLKRLRHKHGFGVCDEVKIPQALSVQHFIERCRHLLQRLRPAKLNAPIYDRI
jgi:hypothetical protein